MQLVLPSGTFPPQPGHENPGADLIICLFAAPHMPQNSLPGFSSLLHFIHFAMLTSSFRENEFLCYFELAPYAL
jgi:hypothetical protein